MGLDCATVVTDALEACEVPFWLGEGVAKNESKRNGSPTEPIGGQARHRVLSAKRIRSGRAWSVGTRCSTRERIAQNFFSCRSTSTRSARKRSFSSGKSGPSPHKDVEVLRHDSDMRARKFNFPCWDTPTRPQHMKHEWAMESMREFGLLPSVCCRLSPVPCPRIDVPLTCEIQKWLCKYFPLNRNELARLPRSSRCPVCQVESSFIGDASDQGKVTWG